MHITHSFKGSVQGKFRYSFFVLYEDYVQVQSSFVRELDLQLERFARNLGDDGVVVRPFLGDIDRTKGDVLSKDWTAQEKEQLKNTPGLLVIDKDFDEFNPREHQWLYLNLGGKVFDTSVSIDEYEDILATLVEIIADPESDFFKEALPVVRQLKLASFAEIFEAKPEIFGFSVDLKKAANMLRSIIR
jgi:hypothetical protein